MLEVHSGAFAKYVGRLDFVASDSPDDLPPPCTKAQTSGRCYDPVNGFEIISHQYKLIPITDNVPQNRAVAELLEPYRQSLDELVDLDLLVGYAPDGSKRFGTGGGDSPLGNMIATGMWRRLGIETDFSLTNTTGIRADMVPGPVTVEQMFNIFPFDNSITKMQLSGVEVQEMFDFVARRSAGRGCASQAQIAGARVVLNCTGCNRVKRHRPARRTATARRNECNDGKCAAQPCAEHIYIGSSSKPCSSDADCGNQLNSCDTGQPRRERQGALPALQIDPTGSYEFATSNYLAGGGSGFTVLKRNTTQLDTKIQQRDALIDWIRAGKPCGYSAENYDQGRPEEAAVPTRTARPSGAGYVCACPEDASETPDGTCSSNGSCSDGRVRAVGLPAGCRELPSAALRQSQHGEEPSPPAPPKERVRVRRRGVQVPGLHRSHAAATTRTTAC